MQKDKYKTFLNFITSLRTPEYKLMINPEPVRSHGVMLWMMTLLAQVYYDKKQLHTTKNRFSML